MNTDDVDVKDYLLKVILGGRQYCLKEPLSTLPKARMQLKALYVLDKTFKTLFLAWVGWTLLKWLGLAEPLMELFSKN